MKLLRYLGVVLALALTFCLAVPVSAAPIASPTSYQIDKIEVYRNYAEELDQLWIVTYTITYGTPPTAGTAEQLFIIRLMNGTTEIRNTAPYPYFNDGYAKGVVAFYFSSSDTDLPTWSGAYSVKICGNPTVPDGWADSGMITGVTNNSIDLWFDSTTVAATEDALTVRFRGLASNLEITWDDLANYDLITPSSKGLVFTDVGEGYFTNIIDGIRTQLPDLFAASVETITYDPDETFTQPYANALPDRLTGTRLDFTNFGFNVSGGRLTGLQASSLTWFILMIAFSFFLCWGLFKQLNVAAAITLIIFNISLPFGWWFGFVDGIYAGVFFGVEAIVAFMSYWAFKT